MKTSQPQIPHPWIAWENYVERTVAQHATPWHAGTDPIFGICLFAADGARVAISGSQNMQDAQAFALKVNTEYPPEVPAGMAMAMAIAA